MEVQFEFNKELRALNDIIVSDIGEFALEAYSDDGCAYYMVIKTVLGVSLVATCGPIVPDIDELPSTFSINIYRTPFNENRLSKTIDLFLNDKHKAITQAQVIDIDDAIENFRDVRPYIKNFTTTL